MFFGSKNQFKFFFENILGSALKSCMKKDNQKLKKKWKVFFMGEKPTFIGQKKLSVNTCR